MNISVDKNSSDPEEIRLYYNQGYVYVRAVGACINSAVGSVLNIGAVVLLAKFSKQNPQNRLMMNLCVTNILFCTVVMPFLAYSHFHSSTLPQTIPDCTCRIMAYLIFITQGQSFCSLLLITLNRYFIIVHPHSKYLGFGGFKKTLVLVLGAWLLSLTLTFPPVIGLWGRYGYEPYLGVCTLVRFYEHSNRIYTLSTGILSFFLPLFIMMYAYSFILYVVWSQKKKIHHGNSQVEKNQWNKEVSITKLSLRLILTYIILFLPNTLLTIFKTLNSLPLYQAIAAVLSWSHTILNPLLYIWGDTQLRRTINSWKEAHSRRDTQPASEIEAPQHTAYTMASISAHM